METIAFFTCGRVTHVREGKWGGTAMYAPGARTIVSTSSWENPSSLLKSIVAVDTARTRFGPRDEPQTRLPKSGLHVHYIW